MIQCTHVCMLSMGLEKLKFDKVMSVLKNNRLMLSVHPLSYDALGKLLGTREARVAFGYLLV